MRSREFVWIKYKVPLVIYRSIKKGEKRWKKIKENTKKFNSR